MKQANGEERPDTKQLTITLNAVSATEGFKGKKINPNVEKKRTEKSTGKFATRG